ncbi:MAG: M23 family metallopeptidase [Acidimicrobiales bacterium]|nr:M23 family metallopeptidase [Acidimicrobiales bacterium]MCB9372928.1 M23 family metallopeptidase [Microthrixaceae bacterium]
MRTPVRSAAALATTLVATLVCLAVPASAGPIAEGGPVGGPNGVDQGDFQMPFPCGQVWGASTHADHPAVDWNGVGPAAGDRDEGLPVLAGLGGTVLEVGPHRGYGDRVVVDHGDGWASLYAHLSAITVEVGERVTAATQVGNVGNTGSSGGPHLHWEQRYLGQPVPVLWAAGAPITTTYGSPGPTYTSQNCPPRAFGVSFVPAPRGAAPGPTSAKR